MAIFCEQEKLRTLQGNFVYLDNDFLGQLFDSPVVLEEALKLLTGAFLTVDQFTEFEFVRDIFVPDQRGLRQEFIENFDTAVYQYEVMQQIHNNALIISKIYSHQQGGYNGSGKGASFVDLFLAGRAMLNPGSSYVISGNKKDFSPALFNTINAITIETNKGGAQTFYVLQFSKEKFEQCFRELTLMEERFRKESK